MRFKLSFDGADDVIKYFLLLLAHTPVDPRLQSLSLLKSFLLAAVKVHLASMFVIPLLCDAHHTSIFS